MVQNWVPPRSKNLNPSVRPGNFRSNGKWGVFQRNKPKADKECMSQFEPPIRNIIQTFDPMRISAVSIHKIGNLASRLLVAVSKHTHSILNIPSLIIFPFFLR
jgi:hypothetical protein